MRSIMNDIIETLREAIERGDDSALLPLADALEALGDDRAAGLRRIAEIPAMVEEEYGHAMGPYASPVPPRRPTNVRRHPVLCTWQWQWDAVIENDDDGGFLDLFNVRLNRATSPYWPHVLPEWIFVALPDNGENTKDYGCIVYPTRTEAFLALAAAMIARPAT
jgi:hypothetical protein